MFDSGALFDLSGTVAINGTWAEDIYFSQAGQPMDLTGLSFRLTFRRCDPGYSDYRFGWAYSCTTPDFTLSTDAGTLEVVDDPDGNPRVLRITSAPGAINCSGDYVADLASEDLSGVITPWAHGRVTFRNNPPVWG